MTSPIIWEPYLRGSADMQQLQAEPAQLTTRAIAAMEAGDWPEALALWKVARARFPEMPLALAGEAGALRELGRLDEAEELLTSEIEKFSDAAVLLERARLAQHRRDWDEALPRW